VSSMTVPMPLESLQSVPPQVFRGPGAQEYHRAIPTMEPADESGQRSDTSVELLARVRAGDREALEVLLFRYVPSLKRWASGRLPRWARDIAETEDVVHDTVVRTLRRIDSFEPQHDGALQAYLRQAVMNRIKDECRRVSRRPNVHTLDDATPDDESLSPLAKAIGREGVKKYEVALGMLREEDREAIVGRVELGYDYNELAEMLRKPTANAARVCVSRALVKLADAMRQVR
jgi:RNA polymerase sigma factor (sigma-70 family)